MAMASYEQRTKAEMGTQPKLDRKLVRRKVRPSILHFAAERSPSPLGDKVQIMFRRVPPLTSILAAIPRKDFKAELGQAEISKYLGIVPCRLVNGVRGVFA